MKQNKEVTQGKEKEQIEKLKKKIKSLKQEISYLNNILADADESSWWDIEELYTDARDGLWNGQKIDEDCKPDKKYVKFIVKRYGLKIDKDGEII